MPKNEMNIKENEGRSLLEEVVEEKQLGLSFAAPVANIKRMGEEEEAMQQWGHMGI